MEQQMCCDGHILSLCCIFLQYNEGNYLHISIDMMFSEMFTICVFVIWSCPLVWTPAFGVDIGKYLFCVCVCDLFLSNRSWWNTLTTPQTRAICGWHWTPWRYTLDISIWKDASSGLQWPLCHLPSNHSDSQKQHLEETGFCRISPTETWLSNWWKTDLFTQRHILWNLSNVTAAKKETDSMFKQIFHWL